MLADMVVAAAVMALACLATAVLVLVALRRRQLPAVGPEASPADKALTRVQALRSRLLAVAPSEYGRCRRQYHRSLKVALAVYAWERYGVAVRNTLHERDVARAPGSELSRQRLRELGGLLVVLDHYRGAGGSPLIEMTRQYDRAVGFLQGEARTAATGEKQPAPAQVRAGRQV